MSFKCLKKDLTEKQINELKNDCFVVGKTNKYGPAPRLRAYGETTNALYLPLAFAKANLRKSNKNVKYPKTNYRFKFDEYSFRTDGGRDQEAVFNQARALIMKYGSVLLSLYCGYGKSFEAICLASSLGMKTAILAHRDLLFDQLQDSIAKFTTAKSQRVGTDGILDPDADFYIFNTAFVSKKWDKDKQKWVPETLGRYKQIGLVIVDEAHTICAETMAKALLHFNPKYAIALTATPKRQDGMDRALEMYFGEYKDTQIVRINQSPFLVYRLPTGLIPDFEVNKMGGKDWTSLEKSVTSCEPRNQMILKLAQKYKKRKVLILTRRIDHCKHLSKELDKLGITNRIKAGTTAKKKVVKKEKAVTVLLGTYSKVGTGFDDATLDTLIITCSVKEVEQYAGRLRDFPGKSRIVIDMVDNDCNCLSHWSMRRKWYISRNAKVKHYFKEFPEEKEMQIKNECEDEEPPVEKPKRLARTNTVKVIEEPVKKPVKKVVKKPVKKVIKKPVKKVVKKPVKKVVKKTVSKPVKKVVKKVVKKTVSKPVKKVMKKTGKKPVTTQKRLARKIN